MPARRNFECRRVITKSVLDLIQADLLDQKKYDKEMNVKNCFFKYIDHLCYFPHVSALK